MAVVTGNYYADTDVTTSFLNLCARVYHEIPVWFQFFLQYMTYTATSLQGAITTVVFMFQTSFSD